MAYGLKYTLQFRDKLKFGGVDYTNVWTVNIYENGYGGSSSSFIGADSPLSLNYKKQDIFSPIVGSELTIKLMATELNQYDEFMTADPLQYYVDVLKNGTTWWSGVNTTDNFTQAYGNAPYAIQLKFNDGLGELQWRNYENAGNLYTGMEQVVQIISNCLSFLPYTKNLREMINIREDNMDDAKGLFEQLYLADTLFCDVANDGVVHGIPCLKLLNQLMTALNCRMYQSNNMWFVERIYERVNSSITYFDYTLNSSPQTGNSFTHSATGSLNLLATIDNSSIPKILASSEVAATQKYSAITYKFNSDSVDSLQLIPNPYFEDKPTAKTSTGLPLRWDIQTTYTDEKIELVDPYNSDDRYRTAFSFGATSEGAQRTYGAANGLKLGNIFQTFTSQQGAHAVQRTGDTWTRNWLYIDPVNGSLAVDFRFFIRLRFTNTTGSLTTDNFDFYGGTLAGMQAVMKFQLQDSSGNNYYMTNAGFNGGWQKNPSVPTYGSVNFYSNSLMQQPFCLGTLNAQRYSNPSNATSLLYTIMSQNKTIGSTFDILFWPQVDYSWAFTTGGFPTSPGVYKFDFKAFPPLMVPTATTSTTNYSIQLVDFAINAVDIEYKDSYNTSVDYQSFYSMPDLDNRWGEKQVSVVYGDTMTPGYPGNFRLSSSTPTSSWHDVGNNLLFNNSTSVANPGTGKLNFNSSTIASVTKIDVSTTDQNGNSVNMPSINQKIRIFDSTSGAIAYFTVTNTTSGFGYFTLTVTFVSSSGSFSNNDSCWYDGNPGTILADILYQNAVQLVGTYRNNYKAKIIGAVDFWQGYSLTDTLDTYTLMQTGAVYDIKNGMISVDMEQMADYGSSVTKFTGSSTTTTVVTTVPFTPSGVSTPPIHTIKTTPVSKASAIITSGNPSYPI